ncbi:hypothetical protein N1851_006585 [Merluccius polli]|uniref:Uncharacterized protein n=1 Tax=Merluccius polli TaxID=89951 RepID=A0AA47P8D7_MERPO|nr:hypothetical protein N1851_006585 [Merluccius polli]
MTWVTALPLALMAMCSSPSSSTLLSPHELVTGRPMQGPYSPPSKGPPSDRFDEVMQEYLQALTQASLRDTTSRDSTILNYCHGIATVFELDICRLMNCGLYADSFYKAEKYLCIATGVSGYYRGLNSCKSWSQASWLTHPGYKEGYYPKGAPWTEVQKQLSMCKEQGVKGVKGNLILLTVKAGLIVPGIGQLPYKKEDSRGFALLLGTDVVGEDPLVFIYLQAQRCPPGMLAPSRSNKPPVIVPVPTPHVFRPDLEEPEAQGDTWEVETGGLYENMWVKWMNYTAQAQGKTNCIIYASGRPRLTTAPARITPLNSAEGFACLLGLFVESHIPGCPDSIKILLDVMYPQIPMRVIPPSFEVNLTPHYHCIRGNGKGRKVGSLPPGTCNTTREIISLANMTRARSDIWWFCGGASFKGGSSCEFLRNMRHSSTSNANIYFTRHRGCDGFKGVIRW